MELNDQILKQNIKSAQRAIIDGTKGLSLLERSRVWSQMQRMCFKVLTSKDLKSVGNTTAFYSMNDNTINLICDNLTNEKLLHTMIHEIIHLTSSKPQSVSGFMYDIRQLRKATYARHTMFRNFNEGATEYYALLFDKASTKTAYHLFVNIYHQLSKTCGKRELMNCYFKNNMERVRQLVVNNYGLPNSALFDKLLLLMDLYDTKKGLTMENVAIANQMFKIMVQMEAFKNLKLYPNLTEKQAFDKVNLKKLLSPHLKYDSYDKLLMFIVRKQLKDEISKMELYKSRDKELKHILDCTDQLIIDLLNAHPAEWHKKFISENFVEIMLLFHQSSLYAKSNLKAINDKLIMLVANYMKHDANKIDFSGYAELDKGILISIFATESKKCRMQLFRQIPKEELLDYINLNKDNWRLFTQSKELFGQAIADNIDKISLDTNKNGDFHKYFLHHAKKLNTEKKKATVDSNDNHSNKKIEVKTENEFNC